MGKFIRVHLVEEKAERLGHAKLLGQITINVDYIISVNESNPIVYSHSNIVKGSEILTVGANKMMLVKEKYEELSALLRK